MATLLTIDMVTKDALMVLENMLTFTKFVRRKYDSQFAQGGAQIGDTLRIRKPIRPVVTKSATFGTPLATETSVSLQLDTQAHVPLRFTSKEATLNIGDYRRLFLKPAVAALAN